MKLRSRKTTRGRWISPASPCAAWSTLPRLASLPPNSSANGLSAGFNSRSTCLKRNDHRIGPWTPSKADLPWRSSAVAKQSRTNDRNFTTKNDQNDRAAGEHDQRELKKQPSIGRTIRIDDGGEWKSLSRRAQTRSRATR